MPSAKPYYTRNLRGTVANLDETIVSSIEGDLETSLEIADRGGSPNYGSGPYFKARKTATKFYTQSGKTLNIGRSRVGNGSRPWTGIAYIGSTSSYYYVQGQQTVPIIWRIQNYRLVSYLDANGDWWCKLEVRDTGNFRGFPESGFRLDIPKANRLISYAESNNLFPAWRVSFNHQITRNGSYIRTVEYITGSEDVSFNFVNGEYSTFCNITDLGVYLNGSAARFSAAYTDAATNVADSSINTIANILETLNGIKTLAEVLKEPTRALRDLFKDYEDPRNAWLAYRYSYTTTKSDVEEYKLLIERLKALSQMLDRDIHATGSHSDTTGSYKCEIRIPVKQVWPDDTYSWLSKVGIEPNAQNIWDMVPYSFVADWFLHVSDILEWFDNWTYSLTLWPSETWFTYVSSYDNQVVFYRVPGRKLDVPPSYIQKVSAGKTWMMRLADSISLFS